MYAAKKFLLIYAMMFTDITARLHALQERLHYHIHAEEQERAAQIQLLLHAQHYMTARQSQNATSRLCRICISEM